MERNVLKELLKWKTDADRKPLVIRGARQVGKTWLMKEFGKRNYKSVVYFNFDENDDLKTIFINKNPERIIRLLGAVAETKIEAQNTLIILDEIQGCPNALNSLKYFNEKAKEYHIMVAGSLLGTLLAQPQSYPVGQVNLLDLGPMQFDEYLQATDAGLYSYYETIKKDEPIEAIFHSKLLDAYNMYLIVGGMPECVTSWIKYQDVTKVGKIQGELVAVYENDFAKHNGQVNSGRLLQVFRSIVTQLAKENEKFVYGVIKSGARAKDYEEAIEWLVSAGIINRLYNVSKIEHPLKVFERLDCFKLFVFDTGLLKYMAEVDNASILLKSEYQFKGPLTENYVLQQLKGQVAYPRYYADARNELDFLVQNGTEIIPIEVKAGEEKSAPSFKKYVKGNNPAHAIRFSKRGYVHDGLITNMPLYLACKFKELL